MLYILDKDGTICHSSHPSGFVTQPSDQIIYPGVEKFMLDRPGDQFVICSNQAGVEAGHKTIEVAIDEMIFIMERLPLNMVIFCPNYAGDHCYILGRKSLDRLNQAPGGKSFRKPAGGMLLLAAVFVKDREVVFIGDRPEDKAAAIDAGIPFLQAEEWRATL